MAPKGCLPNLCLSVLEVCTTMCPQSIPEFMVLALLCCKSCQTCQPTTHHRHFAPYIKSFSTSQWLTDSLGAGLLGGAEGSALHRKHRSGQECHHLWGPGQAEGQQSCCTLHHQLQCTDAGRGRPGSPGSSCTTTASHASSTTTTTKHFTVAAALCRFVLCTCCCVLDMLASSTTTPAATSLSL